MPEKKKPHPFLVLIGKKVAKYREKRKLSMEELGVEVGLTRAHIHRIENGYNITALTILKLSIALNVEPNDFLKVKYKGDKNELLRLIKPKPKKKAAQK